ncbi:PLP-dependent aminotransferase family protein [Arachnia propionica]|nr:PLP-dependent aminotransferase family protein [Arachnia propionica]
MGSHHLSTSQLVRMLGPWTDAAPTLPAALAATIDDLVIRGFVPAGAMLPPQRELAAALGVSRGTVAAALDLLTARGHASSRQGSGTRVRSTGADGDRHDSGRLFSFTDASGDVIDLSTGALPASRVARRVLADGWGDLDPYLDTDGYFPAGIPMLRQAIAHHLSSSGIATAPDEILVTNGAQHATHLAIRGLLSPGDLVLCEDPTYRGALEAMSTHQVRVEGIPVDDCGIEVEMVTRALRRRPHALHCQTSIHNPTGVTLSRSRRRELAEAVTTASLPVIEDCCSWDLTLAPTPARTLAGLVDPRLHVSCWTLSKLFWGGLRIGWIRATPEHIRTFTELRKSGDLATSVTDQLLAVRMLEHAEAAREERRGLLNEQLRLTGQILHSHVPQWNWTTIAGGSGLWVDTGSDALALTERAGRAGVKLAPGPAFSPHEGHRQRLRLPIGLDPDRLELAVASLLTP